MSHDNAKGIPADKFGKEQTTKKGPRSGPKRMSTDMTRDQHRLFLIEAADRDMTMREYFFYCWETTQRLERLQALPERPQPNKQQSGSKANAMKRNQERLEAVG